MRAMLTALAFVLAAASPASAQGVAAAVRSVELLGGWREPDGSRVAAVEISLQPGWHTYWRVPGEAGIPPRFDWSGSRNLGSVAFEWPRPEIFERFGLRSFGYEDGLVLPVRLRPADPAAPIEIALEVEFGVCDDICAPAAARLAAILPPDAAEDGRARIEAALGRRPLSAAEAGVAEVTCGLARSADGYELTTDVTFEAAPVTRPYAVIETGRPDLWVGTPESHTDGRTVTARASIESTGSGGPTIERETLRLTLLDTDRAIEIRGCRPRVVARRR